MHLFEGRSYSSGISINSRELIDIQAYFIQNLLQQTYKEIDQEGWKEYATFGLNADEEDREEYGFYKPEELFPLSNGEEEI